MLDEHDIETVHSSIHILVIAKQSKQTICLGIHPNVLHLVDSAHRRFEVLFRTISRQVAGPMDITVRIVWGISLRRGRLIRGGELIRGWN